MQRLEVSCAVRRIYTSLGAKGLMSFYIRASIFQTNIDYIAQKNLSKSEACDILVRNVRYFSSLVTSYWNATLYRLSAVTCPVYSQQSSIPASRLFQPHLEKVCHDDKVRSWYESC